MFVHRYRLAAFVLVCAVIAAIAQLGGAVSGTSSSSSSSVKNVPVPATGLYLGMSPDAGQNIESGIAAIDKATGAKHVISRTYYQWDTLVKGGNLSSDVTQAIAAGRTPAVSVKSAENGGSVVKWSAIANGSRDADIKEMANALKATNKPIFFTFMHEPEDQLKSGWGTAAEYRGAWQRIVNVFRGQGADNVSFTMILTGYAYDKGTADQYYPGDSYIDWIGTDPYTWNGCGGNSKTFPDFTTIMKPSADFAAKHGKPLMVAEYGVHATTAADKTKKANWFVDARSAAKKMPAIKALVYFNHDNHDGGDCVWGVTKDSAITAAYSAMAKDSYFAKNPLTEEGTSGGGSTGSFGAPTGVSTTTDTASITVSWSAVSGAKEYSVKYHKGTDADTWVTGITATSTTITGLTNGAEYTIAVRAIASDGTKSDYSSNVTATPGKATATFGTPTGVKATAGNGSIAVSWNAVADVDSYSIKYQKQGGSEVWLTDITATSGTITGLTNGASYTIWVRAIAKDGTKSDYSAPVTATPSSSSGTTPPPPPSPGGLTGGSAGEAAPTMSGLPSTKADTNTPETAGAKSSNALDTEANMRVYDTIQVGNTVYLGGAFTKAGGQTRNGLASFNASTGALTSWNPSATGGDVRGLAASPDGKYIYVGGEFTSIAGKARKFVAKVDASSGALVTSFAPDVSSGLYGLATNGSRVYMGGKFSSVNGTSTGSVAAVDASSGALINWKPNPTGGSVRAVKVSNDGSSVFIGGTFTKVDGQSRLHLARIDASSGAVNGWNPTWQVQSSPQPVFDITLSPDSTRLYAAVAGSGANGGNRLRAFNPIPGQNNELWKAAADGDHNAVAASSKYVFVGGHFDFTGNGDTHKKLYVVEAATGKYVNWDGGLGSITGTHALAVTGNSLLVAGSNTSPRDGFARYTLS